VGICRLQAFANLFEADAVAVDEIGIDGDTDSGTRAAPTENLANTFDLRQFLSNDGIRGVINLCRRNIGGRKGEKNNRSVGGIYLAITGLIRKIGRELAACGVDSGLHVSGGGVDITIQIKLKNDAGIAEAAGRSHLRNASDAAELPLERSR